MNLNILGTLLIGIVLLSEENKDKDKKIRMIQNDQIVFMKTLDPLTNQEIVNKEADQEIPREISSIKPDLKKLETKKAIDGRLTVQKEQEEIQFFYDLS